MSPRVSVILTSYEAGEYIEQAIRSVVDQTYTDWELLVLDDGSRDFRVFAAIDRHGLADKRMRCKGFYPTPKQRAATARYATLLNWGAKHTTGEYLTFLCSDDYYLPDRLERMVAVLDARASVCYGAQRLIGDTEGIRHTRGELAKASNVVDLNSVMLTRAVFDAVDGFDDGPELWRTADARLWDKLTDAGYLFVPVPGGPTDVKRYRQQSVDARVIRGENPWLPSPS